MAAGPEPQAAADGDRVPSEPRGRTAAWYRHFGTVEAPGSSPCYAEWTLGIADDPQLIACINQWPHDKRQPNLLLAAARFLGAVPGPFEDFRRFLGGHWDEVSKLVLSRATQTNEAGRCATLLPSLAAISVTEAKPLALLEVGASAGLVLYPDRYRYEYDDGATVTRLSPVPDPGAPVEAPILRRLAGRAGVAGAGIPAPAAPAGSGHRPAGSAAADGRRPERSAPVPGRGCHWPANEGHMVIDQEDGSNVVPEVDPQRIMGKFLLTHNGPRVALTQACPATSGCTARRKRARSARQPVTPPGTGRPW